MPANFPDSSTLNQVYTLGNTAWIWTGIHWQVNSGGTGILGATGATGLGFAIAKTYANVATLTADTALF